MKDKKENRHNLSFQSMVAGMPRKNIRIGGSRRIFDCGDVVAQAISGKTRSELGEAVGEIYERCRKSNVDAAVAMARDLEGMKLTSKFNAYLGYSKLNFGLQRINIGNRLRNALRRSGATIEEAIVIMGLSKYTPYEKPSQVRKEVTAEAVTEPLHEI